jgi:predicted amidohydrolase YtcJ
VVNSVALKKARITRDTKNPDGGEIMRDSSGEPNGMLLDRAQGRIQILIPSPTSADRDEALVRGARFAAEHGLCTVQVAGTTWPEVDRLKELYAAGKIPIRVYAAIYGPGGDAEKLIKDGPILQACNDRLTVRDIKVVFDGALGSKGAALLEPYSDYNTSGFLTQKPEILLPMFERALNAGIQVETHAIGDRANREILNLYERADALCRARLSSNAVIGGSPRRAAVFKDAPPAELKEARWRVEHAQIVHPDDVPRFAKLGIIPSMQPSHAIGDLHFVKSRLGLERMGRGYQWKSFLKAGCIIAAGSDAPVERGDPLIEFYAAVARKDLKGFSGEGWHPEEAVTREEALKMLTLWPAYASFEEKRSGSIEAGKRADLTILSADIMKVPISRVPATKVLMTIVGGEIVYKAAKGHQTTPHP